MKLKLIISIIVILLLGVVVPSAAQTYSLDECIRTALTNNEQMKNSSLDIKAMEYKIGEVRSALLPTITLANQYQYYTQLPAQYAPASNFGGKDGQYTKMRLNMPQTMSTSLQVSQSLFNKSVLSGLQAARAASASAQVGAKVTEENLVYQVTATYYTVQVLSDNQVRLRENIENLEYTVKINETLVKSELISSNVHNRLLINLENLRNQYDNQQLELTRNANNLKYLMGMDVLDSISVENLAIVVQDDQPGDGSIALRPDIRLQESQLELSRLDRKTIAAGYFPQMSFGFATGYAGYNNEFAPGKAIYNDWIQNTSFSLSMKVQLFDGMQKRYQLRQKDIEIQKNVNTLSMMRSSAGREIADAQENYRTHRNQLASNKTSLDLAEKLFATSQSEYASGLTSITELLNAQTDLSNARTNYSVALLNFKLAELGLKKANGTLIKQ